MADCKLPYLGRSAANAWGTYKGSVKQNMQKGGKKEEKKKMSEIGLRRKTAMRHICGKILEEISQVGTRRRKR